MRFLIVDDSSTMRRIIINTLNKLGHQDVQEAGKGIEGLDRLTGCAPGDMCRSDLARRSNASDRSVTH